MGSNIGVTVRKFFEPERYPGAAIIPVFDKWYGVNRSDVCVIAFEPNPVHAPRLLALQTCYLSRGWTLKVINAAASTEDGTARFVSDHKPNAEYWGSRLVAGDDRDAWDEGGGNGPKPREDILVKTINLAEFIADLAKTFPFAKINAKIDIEGAEHDLLTKMILQGQMCFLHGATIEWHKTNRGDVDVKAAVTALLSRADCTELLEIDDETYLHDGQPFPPGC